MIEKLDEEGIKNLLRRTPEQTVFDWKQELDLSSEEKKSEFLKDIVSMANVHPKERALIVYGVNPDEGVINGISQSYDDANLQQLANGKFDPPLTFLYYQVSISKRIVGVIHIDGFTGAPHLTVKSYGKLREGQILVRKGSSTRAMSSKELWELMLGPQSPHLQLVLKKYEVLAQLEANRLAELKFLREEYNRAGKELQRIVDL